MITPHEHYRALEHSAEARREAYRAVFKTGLDTEVLGEIRAATNRNYVLGTRRFQAEVAAVVGRRVTRGKAGRPPKDPPGPESRDLFG